MTMVSAVAARDPDGAVEPLDSARVLGADVEVGPVGAGRAHPVEDGGQTLAPGEAWRNPG